MKRLAKRYGSRSVLVDVDLTLGAGECLLLCGPNGAGKSTLLRVLATLTPPSAGRLTFDGRPFDDWGPALRRRIGALLHETMLYDELTAEENLLWLAPLYGVRPAREKVAAVLEDVGMAAFCRERVGTFSRGMRQRLALARCLLIDPDLLLLDEPLEGLDQRASDRLLRRLAAWKEAGKTIVVTAHYWEPLWSVIDRVLLLRAGRVVLSEPRDRVEPEELYRRAGMPAGGEARVVRP